MITIYKHPPALHLGLPSIRFHLSCPSGSKQGYNHFGLWVCPPCPFVRICPCVRISYCGYVPLVPLYEFNTVGMSPLSLSANMSEFCLFTELSRVRSLHRRRAIEARRAEKQRVHINENASKLHCFAEKKTTLAKIFRESNGLVISFQKRCFHEIFVKILRKVCSVRENFRSSLNYSFTLEYEVKLLSENVSFYLSSLLSTLVGGGVSAGSSKLLATNGPIPA